MKKRILNLLIVVGICMATFVTVQGLSTSSSCTLKLGASSAETASVGVSKKGAYNIKSNASASNGINACVYAAWTGWPYSLESSRVVAPGKSWSGTEVQSKNSNFYVKLWSIFNKSSGTGSITAK